MRFPEFSGEWKRYRVSDFLDFYSTNSLSWEQLDYDEGEIRNLHYGLIHKGLSTIVNINDCRLPFITKSNTPKNYTLCKNGDIAFADASEDTNDVAKAVEFVNCDDKKIICGLHTIHGRDKLNITYIGYKAFAFSSPKFSIQINRIAQGTKVFSISAKNFSELFIGIPSLDEQKKIVSLLSLIDERIATQNKIIEEYKKLKNAIREKLLKTHIHKSIKTDLANCALIKSGFAGSQNDYKKGVRVTRIETISDRVIDVNKVGYCIEQPNDNEYKLRIGDILFSNINSVSHIGKTAYIDKDYDLYHGMNLLRIVPNQTLITPFYLYLQLNTSRSINWFKSTCNQAVSQASINQTELGKLRVYIPEYQIQIRTCELFSVLNNQLDIEQKNLICYLKLKQHLLTKMFI